MHKLIEVTKLLLIVYVLLVATHGLLKEYNNYQEPADRQQVLAYLQTQLH